MKMEEGRVMYVGLKDLDSYDKGGNESDIWTRFQCPGSIACKLTMVSKAEFSFDRKNHQSKGTHMSLRYPDGFARQFEDWQNGMIDENPGLAMDYSHSIAEARQSSSEFLSLTHSKGIRPETRKVMAAQGTQVSLETIEEIIERDPKGERIPVAQVAAVLRQGMLTSYLLEGTNVRTLQDLRNYQD